MDDEKTLQEQLAEIQVANAGVGLRILDKGARTSLYNEFQPVPQDMQDLLSLLHANLLRRRRKHETRGLGGLFGGTHPRKRD